jgi:maltose alpha-D-glucosyltransferase/alpha-amylase
MLRSFDYAVHTLVMGPGGRGVLRNEDLKTLEPWAGFWYTWVSASFLGAYLATAADAPFVPAARSDLELLLRVALLEKAVYELGYELNHRPDWVGIPLRGVTRLLHGRF